MASRPLHEREHYVPQFYLRRFGSPSGYIWCFDKALDTCFQTNPMNIAQEKGFFEIYGPDGAREDRIESLMSSLETRWKAAIDAVVTDPCMETVTIHGSELAEFCAVQLMRPAAFRQLLREIGQHGQAAGDDNVTAIAHALFILGELKDWSEPLTPDSDLRAISLIAVE